MTSLLEQKESLLRLQKDTAKQIEKINRELLYENMVVEDLEQEVLDYLDKISNILTYLRDTYNKKYKIEPGLVDIDTTINIKLLEPNGGKNGFTRTVQKIEN